MNKRTLLISLCAMSGLLGVLGLAIGAAQTGSKRELGAIPRLVWLRIERWDASQGSAPAQCELGFLLPQSGKRPLGVDRDSSHVTVFADDKGGNLAGSNGPMVLVSTVDGNPVLRVAGKAPLSGAKELILRGQVVVNTVAHETTVRETLTLKHGASLPSDLVEIRVREVENVALGDVKMLMTIQSSQGPQSRKLPLSSERISRLEFYGPDGKRIEHDQMAYKSGGSPEAASTEITYGLHRRVDTLTVEFRCVDKVEAINIPLDVRTGVGL